MTSQIVVAHQYSADIAADIAPRLPDSIRFLALGQGLEHAWAVPADADVLLISPDSKSVGLEPSLARPEGWPFNLRWAHIRSTGIDKYPDWIYDVPLLTVTRGVYAPPIADYVLAAVLSFEKQIPEMWATSRDTWRPRVLGGIDGKTLGVVGFGHIGAAVARRALAFDMEVIGSRRSGGDSGMDGVSIAPLETVLERADHLVVCAPLTEQTRHMIDATAFARMKPGAHIINVGRGPIIVTDALRDALDNGLGGATLDVTDPEPPPEGHWLYSHPKVRLSPHVSGHVPDTDKRATRFFLANLDRFVAGDIAGLQGQVRREAGY